MLCTSCTGDQIVVPEGEEPFLYLVLGKTTVNRAGMPGGQRGQHALLLTIRSPAESPRFRTAERFVMRRASGDRRFGWRENEMPHEIVGSFPDVDATVWNYFLPDSVPGEPAGASAIEPGARYELFIETKGVEIRGHVRVPVRFEATLVTTDDGRTVVWPSVRGAAGYRIHVAYDEVRLQSDTSYTLRDADRALDAIRVDALDPNLWRYLTEDQTARAGIDNGYGVFGAVTSARVMLDHPDSEQNRPKGE